MSNKPQGAKAEHRWKAQVTAPSKWKAEEALSYLLLLLTAIQTARIRASARRDARMMSHSGEGEPKNIHEPHRHTS